jgi:aspartate carbamoyltransferase catalytic subunit
MWLPREIDRIGPAGSEIRRTSRMDEALADADVIIVLRVQSERMNEPSLPTDEYVLQYQLNEERLALARPGALVLHPGPMIRGLEIDSAVADGPQSCVLEQVTNGVAVRMALLYLLTGGEPSVEAKKDPPSAGD